MPVVRNSSQISCIARNGERVAYAVRNGQIVYKQPAQQPVLLTPAMTSNTTPAPYVITQSSFYTGRLGFLAFNQLPSGASWTNNNSEFTAGVANVPVWIQAQIPVARTLTSVIIRSPKTENTYQRFIKTGTLYGSNDGSNYSKIIDITAVKPTAMYQPQEFPSPASAPFSYFKLDIKTINNAGSTIQGDNYVELGEIELYGL